MGIARGNPVLVAEPLDGLLELELGPEPGQLVELRTMYTDFVFPIKSIIIT